MLKNEDIICISSIDWDFIWQGHQEIMTRLARNGNRVLFIENTGVRMPRIRDLGRIKKRFLNWKNGVHGIRKVEEGLYVYSPLVLPFPYFRPARFINKKIMFSVLFRWLKAVGFREPVVWTFLPTGLTLDLVDELEPKVLVYYCIDSFRSSSKEAAKIEKTEIQVLKKADLVFVTSTALFNYCSEYSKNVYYFPFGVNIDNFVKCRSGRKSVPQDIEGIKKPIAGYIGGVHKWIDFDLIRSSAQENKDVSFVFCGPLQTDVSMLDGMKNVHFLGQKSAEQLPDYVDNFDLALIPYVLADYTNNVYPTKLNEYLSLGKRVISTALPEVIRFNKENSDIVSICRDKTEFSRKIKEAISKKPTKEECEKAVETAKQNSWAIKISKMSDLIEAVEDARIVEKEKAWNKIFLRIYKGTRSKLVSALLGIVVFYFLFFYTPFIWWVGKPLLVKSEIKRADLICVLGGGVGESGKVGEGYEERAQTAIDLYKNGFSHNILYMSGFKYIMKEAEIMRALSVFHGVEESDIFIDETAHNTYDMVKNLRDFMVQKRMKSVIIVTSPYHTKRLALLSGKILGGDDVYMYPIENSEFYSRGDKVKLKQIKGILHEYLAILYYKYKRYF